MSLSDSLLNAVTGSNISTHKVSVGNLAEIINQTFLQNAERYEIDKVERAIRGKIFGHRYRITGRQVPPSCQLLYARID